MNKLYYAHLLMIYKVCICMTSCEAATDKTTHCLFLEAYLDIETTYSYRPSVIADESADHCTRTKP